MLFLTRLAFLKFDIGITNGEGVIIYSSVTHLQKFMYVKYNAQSLRNVHRANLCK